MNLTLSVSLLNGLCTRLQAALQSTGPLASEAWVLVANGPGSFDIARATGNSAPPALSSPDGGLIDIGAATGWRFAPANATSPGALRIRHSVSNSSAPTVSAAQTNLILIGA